MRHERNQRAVRVYPFTDQGDRNRPASAELYSAIETAKANGIEPLKYIQALLEELSKRKQDEPVKDLMPWAIKY